MAKKKKRQGDMRRLAVAVCVCIFLGVVAAAGIAYFQGGVRRYRLEKVLLSPDVVVGRARLDPHVLNRSWVFERITFECGDRLGRRFIYAVAPERYDRFYQLAGNAKGVRGPEEQLAARFSGADALVLTLVAQGQLAGREDQHQVVQFSPGGNLFRVELPEGKKQRWAYFEHPGIETEARRLFLS